MFRTMMIISILETSTEDELLFKIIMEGNKFMVMVIV